MTRLNDDELAFFSENGFVGPFPSIFEAPEQVQEEIGSIFGRESTIYPREQVQSAPQGELKGRTPEEHAARRLSLSNNRDRHLESGLISAMIRHPEVAGRVASILGEHVMAWRTIFLENRPRLQHPHWQRELGPRTGNMNRDGIYFIFHQGHTFAGNSGVPSIVPGGGVTAWIAIDDATVDNGCMVFLPRTHRIGLIPQNAQGESGRFVDELAWDLDVSQAKFMEMKAGQFVIFDELLVHGSALNTSGLDRRAIVTRLAQPSTYVNKRTHGYDPSLCADMPDPGRAGPVLPRLVYPLEDLRYDNYKIPLDRWGCVMVHGRDTTGYNRMASAPDWDGRWLKPG